MLFRSQQELPDVLVHEIQLAGQTLAIAEAGSGGRLAALLNEIEARYSGWHWLHRDPARALRPPAVERLAELQAPTLVIVGERDVPDIRRMAELLAKGIPGASQIVMPGAGHLPNVEVPKEFNRIVAGFLDRLDAGEASDGGERRSWVPRQDGSFDCAQDDRVNSGLTNTT